jgi:hypothetical protein
MKAVNALLAVTVLVLAISVVSIWFFPSVRDFTAANAMWNGIKDFAREFDSVDIDSLDRLPALPDRAALVVIPYLEYSDEELSKVKTFVEDGGKLILMDDFGYGNEVLSYLALDARFSNRPLLDPLFNYRNPGMPRITDFASELNDRGVKAAVLNHPTALIGVEDADVTAWSSAASFLDSDESGDWNQGEPKGPLPVAARLRAGTGIVDLVADPGIIISSMIGRDDNFGFVAYLTDGKSVLFDSSRVPAAPLDTSKANLLKTRKSLSDPYATTVVVAAIAIVISRYTLRRKEAVG